MKGMTNIKGLERGHRSYSRQAVMQLLRIGKDGLQRLEKTGKLTLSCRDGSVPGYPAEQVDALLRSKSWRAQCP